MKISRSKILLVCTLFCLTSIAGAQSKVSKTLPAILNLLVGEDNDIANDKVKVFIMVGQSNMLGYGRVRSSRMGSLQYLLAQPSSRPRYEHLLDSNGDWLTRNDVILSQDLDQSEPLNVITRRDRFFGPEMQFGQVMGSHYDTPVLLIKAAWGGKSLAVDFRPPSSGGETGAYYTLMLERIENALNNIDQLVPNYNDRGYEILGFGWHQGFNDRINQAFNDEYQTNMVNFINDLRAQLNGQFEAPLDLPFVIASTGIGGFEDMRRLARSLTRAQLATPADPGLINSKVRAIDTRPFWREESVSPSGQDFHWHHNAETYFLIGDSMARKVLELQ